MYQICCLRFILLQEEDYYESKLKKHRFTSSSSGVSFAKCSLNSVDVPLGFELIHSLAQIFLGVFAGPGRILGPLEPGVFAVSFPFLAVAFEFLVVLLLCCASSIDGSGNLMMTGCEKYLRPVAERYIILNWQKVFSITRDDMLAYLSVSI